MFHYIIKNYFFLRFDTKKMESTLQFRIISKLLLLLFILVRNYIHVKSQEYKLKNQKSQE